MTVGLMGAGEALKLFLKLKKQFAEVGGQKSRLGVVGVHVDSVKLDILVNRLKKSGKMFATIGFQEPVIATRAFIQEYGAWNRNANRYTLARPFFRQALILNQRKYAADLAGVVRAVSVGDRRKSIRPLANRVKRDLKGSIRKFKFPPNMPSTRKRKRRTKGMAKGVLKETRTMQRAVQIKYYNDPRALKRLER